MYIHHSLHSSQADEQISRQILYGHPPGPIVINNVYKYIRLHDCQYYINNDTLTSLIHRYMYNIEQYQYVNSFDTQDSKVFLFNQCLQFQCTYKIQLFTNPHLFS